MPLLDFNEIFIVDKWNGEPFSIPSSSPWPACHLEHVSVLSSSSCVGTCWCECVICCLAAGYKSAGSRIGAVRSLL